MKNDYMEGKFMVAANAVIFNKNGEILIVRRNKETDQSPDKWDTVSGRLKQDIKSVEKELLREIEEELGKDFKCKIIAPISTYNFYRGGDKSKELVGIDYYCEYTSGDIVLSDEHSDYMWENPEAFIKYDISESLKKTVIKAQNIRKILHK